MVAEITHIYRYPVKGLSAQALDATALAVEDYLPGDRRFALALGSTPVTGGHHLEWMPKRNFLALVKNEKLASLETEFDDSTGVLTVKRQGRQVARGNIADRIGRTVIEDFFAAYMRDEAKGRPRLVEANTGDRLTDQPDPVISVINLASIRDLERVVKETVDPLRFRANFYVDGIEPWAEFDWIGRTVALGGAEAEVTARIDRCAAVNVNPATADRNLNIVKFLQAGFGHIDMGVYVRVTKAGRVAVGESLSPR
ncbi:MAG: MOSC domain-containing protein [Rhodospirillales bacterium CG15_BIG_FIL_POST_REV_8_21_14_020_66_15]|nr:MAG: MOSC domain-containing protein [Rhodospirillales bacterium CG15_BIG_FIL_POST_REV_8_21_14_020_66_15]